VLFKKIKGGPFIPFLIGKRPPKLKKGIPQGMPFDYFLGRFTQASLSEMPPPINYIYCIVF
jgi:hypothetical protein